MFRERKTDIFTFQPEDQNEFIKNIFIFIFIANILARQKQTKQNGFNCSEVDVCFSVYNYLRLIFNFTYGKRKHVHCKYVNKMILLSLFFTLSCYEFGSRASGFVNLDRVFIQSYFSEFVLSGSMKSA